MSPVLRSVSKAQGSEHVSLTILTAMADVQSSATPKVLSDSVTLVEGERLNKSSVKGLRNFMELSKEELTVFTMAAVN